jgi:hypothetical protein
MALSPRFALDTTAVVGGGFLVVSAMTFSAATAGWLGFGVSTAFAVAAAVAAALTRRTPQKLAHGSLAVVGLWSLIAALVFDGTAQMWLVFASALALAAVALGDLIVHEATTERVVHQLEVRAARPARVGDSEDIAA